MVCCIGYLHFIVLHIRETRRRLWWCIVCVCLHMYGHVQSINEKMKRNKEKTDQSALNLKSAHLKTGKHPENSQNETGCKRQVYTFWVYIQETFYMINEILWSYFVPLLCWANSVRCAATCGKWLDVCSDTEQLLHKLYQLVKISFLPFYLVFSYLSFT